MSTLSQTGKQASRELRVVGYTALFRQLTGKNPIVTTYPEYTQISFDAAQQKTLQDQIEKMISKEPGDVRVDIGPVVTPIMIKRMIVYVAIAAGLGAFAGRYLWRK